MTQTNYSYNKIGITEGEKLIQERYELEERE